MLMWEALSIMQKTFFIMAISASLILTIQFIMLLFGMGDDVDTDGDFDFDDADIDIDDDVSISDAGLRIFTVRGVVSFIAVCGWSGLILSFYDIINVLILIISTLFGFVAMILMALLVKAMLKLSYVPAEESLKSLLGSPAQVYITIPPVGEGMGKITIELGGSLKQVDAITQDEGAIKTGDTVRVIDVYNNLAVVERL